MKFVLTILIAWYGNIVLIRQFLISFSVQLDSIQPKVFLQFLAIMEYSTSWMHQMFCLSYIGNGVTILPKQRVSSLFFTCLYISKPSEIPVIFISSISSQDIKALQSSQQRTENLRKKFIGSLILYSVVMYILAALVCYFYDFPNSWKAKIVRSIPLLVFPFVWVSTLHLNIHVNQL